MAEPVRLLAGKVAVVTGATSGIGAAAARDLADLGATVAVVGHHAGRCARQVEQLRRRGAAAVEGFVADLSSQAEIRRLAERLLSAFPRLDVLVNNAGTYFMKRELSVDGLEMTWALNHLAYFLLTRLLLDRLCASAPARIVNVASSAHLGASLELDDLQAERRYDRLEAYGRSKLANVLFTYELARRLAGSGVTVNALHPGMVATNLGSNNGWLRVKLRNLRDRSLVSPEEGARTVVYLASAPEVEGVTGRYFERCAEVHSSAASYDQALARRLWLVSEEQTSAGGC